MGDVVSLPQEPYSLHVRRAARWLKSREPRLVDKNWRSETNRFYGTLVAKGVKPAEADQKARQFGEDVIARLAQLDRAEKERPPAVVYVWDFREEYLDMNELQGEQA